MNSEIKDTDVFVLLDRTGSMENCWVETISAVNNYIEDVGTSLTDKGRFSILTFDSHPDSSVVQKHKWFVPWAQWTRMNATEVSPRGMTPLYDAIGFTVRDIEASAPADQVTLVIVTDGLENASREWNKDRVAREIKRLRERGWNLVFIGADIDAMAEGAAISTNIGTTATFNKASVAQAMSAVARSTTMYASGARGQAVSFTEDERKAMQSGSDDDHKDTASK